MSLNFEFHQHRRQTHRVILGVRAAKPSRPGRQTVLADELFFVLYLLLSVVVGLDISNFFFSSPSFYGWIDLDFSGVDWILFMYAVDFDDGVTWFRLVFRVVVVVCCNTVIHHPISFFTFKFKKVKEVKVSWLVGFSLLSCTSLPSTLRTYRIKKNQQQKI